MINASCNETTGVARFCQPGAHNESISDVFGSMFRQWRAHQLMDKADWLIGADIMGPAAMTVDVSLGRAARRNRQRDQVHWLRTAPGGDYSPG